MRFIQAVLFLAFLGVVGVFAVENTDIVTINFWNWKQSGPVALFTIVIYLLGMLSGWAVVGFVRRSLRQVADQPRHRTT
jgi:putative membrane protein